MIAFANPLPNVDAANLAVAYPERLAARLGRVRPRDVGFNDELGDQRSNTPADIAAIGKSMGARLVLGGTVTPTSGGVTVAPQLVRVADASVVWSARYERNVAELQALESVIAREAGARAFGQLTAADRKALDAPLTADAEAYRRFLMGNAHFAVETDSAMAMAVSEYTAAARADARFAPAWSRLAMAYALWLEGWSDTPTPLDTKVLPAGLAAAQTALDVDARSSEAWLARAILLERQRPRALSGARTAYERAIALDPRNSEARRRYGRLFLELGSFGTAREHLRQALATDPWNGRALTDLAEISLYERQYPEACRLLNAAVAVAPRTADAFLMRAITRVRFGDLRNAWSDAEVATRLGLRIPGEAAAIIVDVAAKDTATARRRLQRLMRAPRVAGRGPLSATEARYLAIALTAMGERAQALAVLERSAPRGVELWRAMQDPQLEPLRADPRYRKLLAASSPAGGAGQ